jgi:hypothetical protein
MYYRCIRFNTNQERNQVRDSVWNGAKNLSVLRIGAPDCPVCHRTVSGAPGPYRCQPATLGNSKVPSAIIHPDCPVCHRTVLWASEATTIYANGRLCKANSVTAEVKAGSQRGTGHSGVAPDCPVPQEDKALMIDPAPNPNNWVTWRRTGQGTVPIRWRTRLSGAPIANSLPNGYQGGWGL